MNQVLLRYSRERITAQLVADILRVCFPEAHTVVDLTPGRGGFWREDVPIGVSVEASAYDFRCLPYPDDSYDVPVLDDSYDVPVLDPPHAADAGTGSIMGQRYGTYKQHELETVVRAGVREAWRVARLGVIVKVCDAIHRQRFVRMSGWAIDELGLEPFDVVHQVRGRALVDPRWHEPQLSARNNGSTYLIFRKDGPQHRRHANHVLRGS